MLALLQIAVQQQDEQVAEQRRRRDKSARFRQHGHGGVH